MWACNGPRYVDTAKLWPNRLTPRHRWLAFGDLRDPLKAIDGNISTAAVTGDNYRNAALTIDLGKMCQLNMVAIEHGADQFGYCRTLAILTSDDGREFYSQAVVPGLRRVTTVVLPKQVLARYVRLQAIEEGHRPWSIAEVYLN